METVIREYNGSDKDSCLGAFKSNVAQYFTIEEINEFESFLENIDSRVINGKYVGKTYYYVISEADRIVGCGGFGFNGKTNIVTLAWGLVDRNFQGEGFGKKLLNFRLQQIRKLYPTSTVLVDTTQFAYSFFEKYGFVTTKITSDFYAVGMHRYDMRLKAGEKSGG